MVCFSIRCSDNSATEPTAVQANSIAVSLEQLLELTLPYRAILVVVLALHHFRWSKANC